jgi:hypothetical protein
MNDTMNREIERPKPVINKKEKLILHCRTWNNLKNKSSIIYLPRKHRASKRNSPDRSTIKPISRVHNERLKTASR